MPIILKLCEAIANNIVMDNYIKGFFMKPNKDMSPAIKYSIYERTKAKFDDYDPLALLTVEAYRKGSPELVARYSSGEGYVADEYTGIDNAAPGDYWAIYSGRCNVEY